MEKSFGILDHIKNISALQGLWPLKLGLKGLSGLGFLPLIAYIKKASMSTIHNVEICKKNTFVTLFIK